MIWIVYCYLFLLFQHEKSNYSRECCFQTIVLLLFPFMFSFLVNPQVVEPVASVGAIIAKEKFLCWMEGFHVAYDHALAGGFLKVAIVAIKIFIFGFRIVCVTLAMLYVNSALNANYSFNFALSVL